MVKRWTLEQWNKRQQGQKPKKQGRGRATPTVVDGIRFHSKLEARYYEMLKLRVLAPSDPLQFFLRQVPIPLGGGVTYRIDFVEFSSNYDDPEMPYYVTWTDVKGYETEMFKTKKKLVESMYPIKINVVTRDDF